MKDFFEEKIALIPILSDAVGQTLTIQNWQQVGVKTASFYLSDLLVKPGAALLNSIVADKRNLVAQEISINASLPASKEAGYYRVHSTYDGQICQCSLVEVLELVCQIQPSMVVLPEGIGDQSVMVWDRLPPSIFPFIPIDELSSYTNLPDEYGLYVSMKEEDSETISLLTGRPHYLAGEITREKLLEIKSADVMAVESNLPVRDALRGTVYQEEHIIQLTDPFWANHMERISEKCACTTCQQGFSIAYLHHLYFQTPLLAQRFLAQHNVYTFINALQLCAMS